jgi:hypothetical protein
LQEVDGVAVTDWDSFNMKAYLPDSILQQHGAPRCGAVSF